MKHPLRLLIVDDQHADAELSAQQIARGGYPCTWRRVENEADFRTELHKFSPDLILSDFTLPQYDGLAALKLAVKEAPGVPFIFVSGTIGEKRATEALTRGAAGYVSKNDPTRLLPAVARVMTEFGPAATRGVSADLPYAEPALGEIRGPCETPQHRPLSVNASDSGQGALAQRLRFALKHQQFQVHYQPLIERVSGRVIAVEALLRWRDPERGLISPRVFLPALEQSGLILPVGEWVLSQAVRDFARWHSIGLPKIRVAVNISTTELLRNNFAGYFLDTTRLSRTSPGIDIEITERALLDDTEKLRQTLKSLRGEGVRIAVDNFGVVHSSLSRLSEFPVDSLKIDRTFVSHLSFQPQSQAVVSTTIALARAYGLRTVAEGVETIEQLEILDALGCEQSQGYLHSPAVSANDFELLVAIRGTAAQHTG